MPTISKAASFVCWVGFWLSLVICFAVRCLLRALFVGLSICELASDTQKQSVLLLFWLKRFRLCSSRVQKARAIINHSGNERRVRDEAQTDWHCARKTLKLSSKTKRSLNISRRKKCCVLFALCCWLGAKLDLIFANLAKFVSVRARKLRETKRLQFATRLQIAQNYCALLRLTFHIWFVFVFVNFRCLFARSKSDTFGNESFARAFRFKVEKYIFSFASTKTELQLLKCAFQKALIKTSWKNSPSFQFWRQKLNWKTQNSTRKSQLSLRHLVCGSSIKQEDATKFQQATKRSRKQILSKSSLGESISIKAIAVGKSCATQIVSRQFLANSRREQLPFVCLEISEVN